MNLYSILAIAYLLTPLASQSQIDSNSKKSNAILNAKKKDETKKPNQIQPKQKPLHSNFATLLKPVHDTIANRKSDTILAKKDSVIRYLTNENVKLKYENKNLQNQLIEPVEKSQDTQSSYTKNQFISIIFYSLGILILLIVLFVVFLLWRKTSRLKTQLAMSLQTPQNLKPSPVISKTINAPIFQQKIHQPIKSTSSNFPISFSNIVVALHQTNNHSNDWYVVGASAIGKSHISGNMPCQDNHYCESFGNGWGIAISCDGAGSAENSNIGSEFVAKEAFKVFKEIIYSHKYEDKKILPSENEWKVLTGKSFNEIALNLEKYAMSNHLDFDSVACTLIVVVFTPIGLLVAHIGDGRAGYCNQKHEWKSIITPHKGEEANQTIFITSKIWRNSSDYMMSGVNVPESRVISEKAIAFTLMSDGCENHSFDCSKMDTASSKWEDPNIPFPKFFNPLVETLKAMYQNKVSVTDAGIKWRTFVEEGTQGLKEESDDKTLILGILN